MENQLKTKIYALRDNHWIKYVGKTVQPLEVRLAQHLKASRDGDDSHRGNGIRKMLGEGRLPTITLITIANGNGDKEEIAWIAYFRSHGIKLWNMTDGGDGCIRIGHEVSTETRNKIRKTLQEYYKDPKVREKAGVAHKKRCENPAVRERIRIASIKRFQDPREHEKLSIAHKKALQDPGARERNRLGQIKRFQDPKEHEKLSIAHLKRYQDPKEREKIRIANLKRFADPKEREKISIAKRKQFLDPKAREKDRIGQIKRFQDTKERDKISVALKKYYGNPENRLKHSIAVTNGWAKVKAKLLQKQVSR